MEDVKIDTPMIEKNIGTALNNAEWDRQEKSPAPKDRFIAVYLIFYILGLGTLLPWNFFITAHGYWMFKFRDQNYNGTDQNHRSDLQTSWGSNLSIASMVPNTVFLLLNTILSRRISQKLRLVAPLVLIILLFIVTEAMVLVDTNSWQNGFFIFTLIKVALLNCNTAVFQGALFGLGGTFPPRIIQAIMNGQALGGIFAALASILSIAGGSTPTASAFGYFLTAIITLIASLVAYTCLPKFEYYNHYISAAKYSGQGGDIPLLEKDESKGRKDFGKEFAQGVQNFWNIFLQIKIHAISVCLVFFVTLAAFPAVSALVGSAYPETTWGEQYFIAVACFLMFNVSDFTGRTLAGYFNLPQTRIPMLPLLCTARIVFIPLFMFCNAHPRNHIGVAFHHDAYYIVFMALFSGSGGYLASQAMIHGPKHAEAKDQESAGAMMAFFLGLGLMLGAVSSKLFVYLL